MGSHDLKLDRTIKKQPKRFFSDRSSRESRVLWCLYYSLARSIWEEKFMPRICGYYDAVAISEVIPHEKQCVDLLYLFEDIFVGTLQKFFEQSEVFIDGLVQMMLTQKLGNNIESVFNARFRQVIVAEIERLCIDRDYFAINMLCNHLYQSAYQLVTEKKSVAREIVRLCKLPMDDLDDYLSSVLDRFANVKHISQIARNAVEQYNEGKCFGNYASIYRSLSAQLMDCIDKELFDLNDYCNVLMDKYENKKAFLDEQLYKMQTPTVDPEKVLAVRKELLEIKSKVGGILGYLQTEACKIKGKQCEYLKERCRDTTPEDVLRRKVEQKDFLNEGKPFAL